MHTNYNMLQINHESGAISRAHLNDSQSGRRRANSTDMGARETSPRIPPFRLAARMDGMDTTEPPPPRAGEALGCVEGK